MGSLTTMPQMGSGLAPSGAPLVVHGLDLSYFTGKLEAYLRAKGLPYRLAEMDTAAFRRAGSATGYLQMPQIELSDGRWLTDTTLIIRYFEAQGLRPAITPEQPAARFLARFLEDFGDEGLWRPALYYRWAFDEDAQLMSGRTARGMMRDINLPFFIRKQMILRRQRSVYLHRDGANARTAPAIEQLYLDTLAAMEVALKANPFILGRRPSEADFGLFGSMFRHFFSDPTPARIMRDRAAETLAWVGRVWALGPADFSYAAEIASPPEAALNLIRLAASVHLPPLLANARAIEAGERRVRFEIGETEFATPVSPYRAWCLSELQREYQELDAANRYVVDAAMGLAAAREILMGHVSKDAYPSPPELPLTPSTVKKPKSRKW